MPQPELVGAGAGAAAVRGGRARPRREPAVEPPLGPVAMALTVLGALTHIGVLVTRGLAAGRLPWGNMYEFAHGRWCWSPSSRSWSSPCACPALRHLGLFVLAPGRCWPWC